MTTTTPAAPRYRHVYVVPCGAAKVAHPAPARDLYTGSMFRYVLDSVLGDLAACEEDARVMILSAKYGLVDLDTTLAPYDVTMGDEGAVSVEDLAVQVAALGAHTLYAFLPGAYRHRLEAATTLVNEGDEDDELPWVTVQDVYEAAPGIGYQRGVCAAVRRFS